MRDSIDNNSLKPVTVSNAKNIPENRTPVNPTCQGIPIVNTTVKAKMHLTPYQVLKQLDI